MLIITIQVKIFICEMNHTIEGEIIKFSLAIKIMELTKSIKISLVLISRN